MSETLTGQFLIAAKRLRDSNFYQSIVLIVEHGAGGAMGLIVNRPSDITVAQALESHFELPETDDRVFTGGPVEQSALFVLHNSDEFDGAESPVVPGLYVGTNAQVFEAVVREAAQGSLTLKYRIFAGCSGWSAGQLEGELSRGDWLVTPATLDLIFYDDPYKVWSLLMRRVSTPDFVIDPPENPEWN